jgi:hypothetical protein
MVGGQDAPSCLCFSSSDAVVSLESIVRSDRRRSKGDALRPG